MSDDIASHDIAWLARRCADLHAHLRKPSRRQLNQAEKALDAVAASEPAVRAASLKATVASLFARMGQEAMQWLDNPTQDALPMVALLPGIGCRIVYARTGSGHWLLEGPNGSQELHHLPLGGQYAAIGGPVRDAVAAETGTAYELFRSALSARKSIFLQAALASLLANVLALVASFYSMQVYDRVIPTQGVSTLVVLTTGVLLAAVLELLVRLARSRILERSVKGMDLEISHKIFLRLLGIRMDQFPASVGTLSSQLRSYETIRSFASSVTLYLAVDAPFALFFLGAIFILGGPEVAIVPLTFFFAALTIGMFYRGRIARHAKSGTTVTNRKLGLLVETVECAESIKAAGTGWQLASRWDRLNRQSVDDDLKIRHYSEQATLLAVFMQQVSYILLIAMGAYVASTNHLTTGGLVACSILSGRVLSPVGALPGLLVMWAHARSALESLEKVFSLERDNHGVDRPLAPDVVHGAYVVSDLRFMYPRRPAAVSIKALDIRAGEKIAVIGAIGAGKSTLLKLLAGLYAPTQGNILLDGLALQQIARHHLCDHIGYLAQDVRLLAGSLRENLLAGLPAISEQDMLQACQATGLAAVAATHPKGFDLEIAEGGSGVSGGQKQLIALTRLILSKPSIWLLDEPTAAMDEQSEQRSLAALRHVVGATETMILITHKPVLLGLVDRIIVLASDGIVMDGPRDAVLAQLHQNSMRLQVVKPAAEPVREGL